MEELVASEASTQTYILKKLNQIPFSEWMKPTTTNKAGSQDIIGNLRGYYIAIEVKKNVKTAVPTTLQKYRIKETNRIGGLSFWSNNWRDVEHQLLRFAESKGFSLYD